MTDNYTLFLVKMNQVQMVADRGFEIEEDEIEFLKYDPDMKAETLEEQKNYFDSAYSSKNTRTELGKIYHKTVDDEIFHLIVYYAYDIGVGNSKELSSKSLIAAISNIKIQIRDIINTYDTDESKISNLIITPLPIGNDKKDKNLTELSNLTILEESKLVVNPTLHKDYSPHFRLDPVQKAKTLREAGVKLKQTSVIRKNDKISEWYGFSRGDLVKIVRNTPIPTIDRMALNYRHCA